MVRITIDPGPIQVPITLDSIREAVRLSPRRMQLSTEWPEVLHEPEKQGQDWSVVLPFRESLWNAFDLMCSVSHIGCRTSDSGRCYTFLKAPDEDDLDAVRASISIFGKYVAIRDCLSLSFALDYDRAAGDPKGNLTEVGELRRNAKPYSKEVTSKTIDAADELSARCMNFINEMTCYSGFGGVAAVPPSTPDSQFSLPAYLASKIAQEIGVKDFSGILKTERLRPELKNLSLDEKLNSLVGTVQVTAKLKGAVLLIDDLYQSGTSLNYAAMLLMEAGAKQVFGLACEKTIRNDDNV